MKRYLLPLISITAVVIILISIQGKSIYKLSAWDLVGRVVEKEYMITPDQYEILRGEEKTVLFDLRDSQIFNQDHLPGAINLPLGDLDIKSVHDQFDNPWTYVLYSGGSDVANQVWILVSQMGFENVLVLVDGNKLLDESPNYKFQPDTSLYQ
ncbi:hypothetical protein LCGC14_2069470 [marine sediment metagenome]|uniref:Rhodanese domain-containing protein n=1 Tax=marine sediment metagenome TaxID=412755 RepID=A0A0F9F673_9ZZZZ